MSRNREIWWQVERKLEREEKKACVKSNVLTAGCGRSTADFSKRESECLCVLLVFVYDLAGDITAFHSLSLFSFALSHKRTLHTVPCLRTNTHFLYFSATLLGWRETQEADLSCWHRKRSSSILFYRDGRDFGRGGGGVAKRRRRENDTELHSWAKAFTQKHSRGSSY